MSKDRTDRAEREQARREAESAEVLRDLAAVDARDAHDGAARRRAEEEKAVAEELELESEYLKREGEQRDLVRREKGGKDQKGES